MLEEGEYCSNIIYQNRAVQAALKKIDGNSSSWHLHSCVLKDVHGKNSEKMVGEILELFKKAV